MKYIKYIKYLLIILTITLIGYTKTIYADYIGTGNPTQSGGDSCSENGVANFSGFCVKENGSGILVKFVYIDNGTILRTYATVVYSTDLSKAQNIADQIRNNNEGNVNGVLTISKIYQNSLYQTSYFRDFFQIPSVDITPDMEIYKILKTAGIEVTGNMTDWFMKQDVCAPYSNIEECTQGAGGSHGFRLIIEPIMLGYVEKGSTRTEYHTIKGLARGYQTSIGKVSHFSNDCRLITWPFVMYMDRNDVGIAAVPAPTYTNQSECTKATGGTIKDAQIAEYAKYNIPTYSAVGNETSGYAMNLVTVTDLIYDNPNPCECDYNGDKICDDIAMCKNKYIVDLNRANNCYNGQIGWVKDINDWNLIFTSPASYNDGVRVHYTIDGTEINSYCKVMCREEIEYTYPSSVWAYQGQYLVVNHGYNPNSIHPIKYKGTKECRLTSPSNPTSQTIDATKFVEDYNAQSEIVVKKWDLYQEALADYEASLQLSTSNKRVSTSVKSGYGSSTYYYNESRYSYGNNTYDSKAACENARQKALDNYKTASEVRNQCFGGCGTAKQDCNRYHRSNCDEIEKQCQATCPKATKPAECKEIIGPTQCKPSGTCIATTYSADVNKLGNYRGSSSVTAWQCIDSSCNSYATNSINDLVAAEQTSKKNALNDALNQYNIAKQTLDNIIAAYEYCVNYNSGLEYTTFNPQLKIQYQDKVYGGSTEYPLVSSTSSNGVSKMYYRTANDARTNYASQATPWSIPIGKTVCPTDNKGNPDESGYRCYKVTNAINVENIPYCSGNCSNNTIAINYAAGWRSTNEVSATYSLANNIYNYVSKVSGESTSTIPTGEYRVIGFGNLPIHYSTPPGDYNYSIKIESFGTYYNQNKFDKYILGTERFDGISYKMDPYYTCQYTIKSRPEIVTKEGLNVIYRTISLYSKKAAFPGINGTGRTPGSNWSDSAINSYIVNNRGVSNYEVYKLDPLYEITMTPSTMKALREYNKKMRNEKITIYNGLSAQKSGNKGYGSYDNITCTNGEKCISQLLRGKVTDKIEVTGCAIRGNNYTKCSATDVAW